MSSYRRKKRQAFKREARTCKKITDYLQSEKKDYEYQKPRILSYTDKRLKSIITVLEPLAKISLNKKTERFSHFEKQLYIALLHFFRCISNEKMNRLEASEKTTVVMFGKHYDRSSGAARRIRKWANHFYRHMELPKFTQGQHVKSKSVIMDEDVQNACREFMLSVPPNQRSAESLREWIGNGGLDDIVGVGMTVSSKTCNVWLAVLGFSLKTSKGRGVYVDGHERDDVVAYRQTFVKTISQLRSRMVDFDSTDECKLIEPTLNVDERKLILVAHDESLFYANDGRRVVWMHDEESRLIPKGEGRSIMVSEFICPCHGPMVINDPECDSLQFDKSQVLMEPGVRNDGYWRGKDVVDQLLSRAIPVFEKLHPGCQALFLFDNSTNHGCFAPNSLRVNNLNMGDGLKKGTRFMRDTYYNERKQSLKTEGGEQKGIKTILMERGLWRDGMTAQTAKALLADQPDFKNQRPWVVETCENANHMAIFLPKFHPELNPIEMYWGACKVYTRKHCSYTLDGLRETVPKALQSVPLISIRKYFRHCLNYMRRYELGLSSEQARFSAKVYSSHRGIPRSSVLVQNSNSARNE